MAGKADFSVTSNLVVLGAALCVLLAGCGGAASRLQSHMERGRAYMDKGDYARASVEFRNALQIAPKDINATLLAAQAAEKLGKPRDSAGLYQAVIDADPDNTQARAGQGRLFVLGGAPDLALKVVEPGLAKHPDAIGLLTVRATARSLKQDVQGAVADADRALALDPTNPDAIAIRSGLYEHAGDVPHAVSMLEAAVKKMPQALDLREVLLELYVHQHDSDKAEQQLRELVKQRPDNFRYRAELGRFYVGEKRPQEARRALEDAVQALPKNDDAKLALVDFLSSQHHPDEAEQLLRKYVAADPGNFDLRFGLGRHLESVGAAQKAVGVYREIIERDNDGPKALLARDQIANIELAAGRLDAAANEINVVLKKNPRDTGSLLVRAQIELAHGDAAAAVTDLRAVAADQSHSMPVQHLLARAYTAADQPALAELALKSALDLAPDDVVLRVEMAELLMRTSRVDAAVKMLEETVTHRPQDPRPRELLLRAYLAQGALDNARKTASDLQVLYPDSPIPFYLSGIVAEQQKRLDDAQKDYERALAINPRAVDALTALTHLLLLRHQDAQAISLVKEAAARDTKDAVPYGLLGEIYVAEKNFPAAIEALNGAVSRAPAWWVAHRNLALAKLGGKDRPGAIAAYQAAIQAAPAEPSLPVELVQLYLSQQQLDAAISVYDAWQRRNPQIQSITNNFAMLLVTYKTDRASLDRAQELVAGFASSADPAMLDTYGWVQFKRGQYPDALRALELAAGKSPATREIRYHLGMAELQAGHSDRARVELEAAVSGAARFPGADVARKALASLKS